MRVIQSAAALLGAFVRAYHTRGSREPLFADSPAYGLLGAAEYGRIGRNLSESMGAVWADGAPDASDAIAGVVAQKLGPVYLGRAVFAESRLETAVRIGAGRYLIFGAGLDSFACRVPRWAQGLPVLEVDHPLASLDKQRRVEAIGAEPTEALWYAAADLRGYMWPAVVAATPGFDPAVPCFCNLTGLTFRLGRLHWEAFLDRLARLVPSGSALVFDYVVGGESGNPPGLYETPCRFTYPELERLLEARGFLIYEHLEARALANTCFGAYNAANPLRPMQPPHGMAFCLAVRH